MCISPCLYRTLNNKLVRFSVHQYSHSCLLFLVSSKCSVVSQYCRTNWEIISCHATLLSSNPATVSCLDCWGRKARQTEARTSELGEYNSGRSLTLSLPPSLPPSLPLILYTGRLSSTWLADANLAQAASNYSTCRVWSATTSQLVVNSCWFYDWEFE